MTRLEEARHNYQRNDHRLKVFLVIFLVYVGLLLTFLALQSLVTQNTIARNQDSNSASSIARFERYNKNNQELHKQTQDIINQQIGCIASELLKAIDTRNFARCGVEVK